MCESKGEKVKFHFFFFFHPHEKGKKIKGHFDIECKNTWSMNYIHTKSLLNIKWPLSKMILRGRNLIEMQPKYLKFQIEILRFEMTDPVLKSRNYGNLLSRFLDYKSNVLHTNEVTKVLISRNIFFDESFLVFQHCDSRRCKLNF